jgi:hypothetical protein
MRWSWQGSNPSRPPRRSRACSPRRSRACQPSIKLNFNQQNSYTINWASCCSPDLIVSCLTYNCVWLDIYINREETPSIIKYFYQNNKFSIIFDVRSLSLISYDAIVSNFKTVQFTMFYVIILRGCQGSWAKLLALMHGLNR